MDDGTGTLRIRLMLIDRTTSRYVCADCFEGVPGDLFDAPDWFSNLASGSLRSVPCEAEIERTAGGDKLQLTAWELSMRALPMVLAADPAGHATAIELLDWAIEHAPRDRFRCPSRRGVTGCAPVTISPLTPNLSATQRFSWHRRRRGLAPATRYPTRCCRPRTCWPTISPPMRRSAGILLLALAVAAPGLAQAGSADVVKLDGKALKAAELRLQVLERSRLASQTAGYGVVLDPARLAALSAALAARRGRLAADDAKMSLKAAEAARAASLYRADQNVALADLQKAQSALAVAKADRAMAAAALAELKTPIRAGWGPALAAAIGVDTDLLPALEEGKELLVRVSLPLGVRFSDPPRMASATAPDGTHIALRFVGRAPRASLAKARSI